jgi:spermidine synthase
LFLLPTLAIGLIQPLILKKFTDDFATIGSKYGILSFAWSAGGIFGVFLTGFFFISNIGSHETIWIMSVILFLVGGIFAFKKFKDKKYRNIIILFLITIIMAPVFIYLVHQNNLNKRLIFQEETNYYNARVANAYIPSYGNSRILALDFDIHSIDPEKAAEDYPEMYPVFSYLKKDIKNILVIGAGAYTMPKYFKEYYKATDVSVIELDPEMINIGNKFFDLKKYDIRTTIGDAKILINKSNEKYDVIFGDAYNSFISVPWYLLTEEWNNEVREKLTENGIYAINFIGSVSGEKSAFTNSVLNTFKISFPNFYIFAFGGNKEDIQNVVLVGIKGDLPLNEEDLQKKLSTGKNSFLADKIIPVTFFKNTSSIILTDNFSPVEKLMEPTIESYFPSNLSQINQIFNPI